MSDAAPKPHGSSDAHLGRHLRFGPVAALVVGALVRFHDLGARSLWTDEGSTWTAASLPLQALLRRCVERDASPPLYYLLTSWALKLGESEAHLRLVSVLASLALVWLTYRLARIALGRGAATFAAFLTALSPFQLMYAQEARTYTLAAALLVAGIVIWARAAASRGRPAWWALSLAIAAGMWTQSIVSLGVLAQGAMALLTPQGRKRFLPWIAAVAGGIVLYLPWWWLSRKMSEHLSSSHWYIPETDASGIFKVFRAALLSPMPLVGTPKGSTQPGLDAYMPSPLAWALVAIPPVVALLLTLPELRRSDSRGLLARVSWLAWIVPVGAVLAESFVHPLLLVRYFVFLTPFVAALFALGLARIRWTGVRVVLATLLLAWSIFGIARYQHDYTKEPWRAVVADLGRKADPARACVLVPFDVDPFAFYDHLLPRPIDGYEVSHPDEPFAAHYTPKQLDEMAASARMHSRPYDEVWVIVRSANSDVRREAARRTIAVAAEGRRLVEARDWTSGMGTMRVERWVREGAAR